MEDQANSSHACLTAPTQSSSYSQIMTNIGSSFSTVFYEQVQPLQPFQPMSLLSFTGDSNWSLNGVCSRKRQSLDFPGQKPLLKNSKIIGTKDNPICLDDASSGSDGLSPVAMNEAFEKERRVTSIKEEVVILQEVDQHDDETLAEGTAVTECSSTVSDTMFEAQKKKFDRSYVWTYQSPVEGPALSSLLHTVSELPCHTTSTRTDNDFFSKSISQAEHGNARDVFSEGQLSFSEMSGAVSESKRMVHGFSMDKTSEEQNSVEIHDESLSSLLYLNNNWQSRGSDSSSVASASDIGGSYSSGCGGSTASSSLWACSRSTDTRHLAARISLGGSLDTATRQLMEAKEAVKKLSGDRTMSKLRITARSLYQVAYHGNLEKVVLLLSKGSDPNARNSKAHGQTPMHAAADKGCVATLMALREAGGEVNIRDANMKSPVFKSVERGHLLAVEYLIHVGAELDIKEETGMTPLHTAVKRGYADIVARLLQTGQVDIDAQDEGGWTAIVWAADLKSLRPFTCLLQHGADLHIQDEEGNVCLHWAAYSGCIEVLELILQKSSFVNALNNHGDTPLHVSVRRGYLECARNLLVKGSDLSLRNNDGYSPMDLAESRTTLSKLLKTFYDLRKLKSSRKAATPRLLSSDLSKGRESVYISCFNDVDDEPAPQFVYVTEPQEGPLVRVERRLRNLQGCSCEGSCANNRNCDCARLNERKRIWYDEEGLMSSEIEKLFKPLIFECNVACSCNAKCRNRVVQRGMKYPLEVYRTKRKGWGVKSLALIPKGAFVCEYTGLLLTDREADSIHDDTYLFDLDVEENVVGCMCIDARDYGNVSRFINHSCEPNIFPLRVYTSHQDRRFPRMAFFSLCEIKPGQEICFDYGPRFWKIKTKEFPCLCEAASCRFKRKQLV